MGEENPGGVLEQLVNGDHGETDEYAGTGADFEGEGVDLVCGAPALRSPGLSCRVSFSQRLSTENDWEDRRCLSVFLTPLDLRNVNFQIFIPH